MNEFDNAEMVESLGGGVNFISGAGEFEDDRIGAKVNDIGAEGMRLLYLTLPVKQKQYLLMGKAYSGKKKREIVSLLVYALVVMPTRNYK